MEKTSKNNSKTIIIAGIILFALTAAAGLYSLPRPDSIATKGHKELTVAIYNAEQELRTISFNTDANTLREALEEQNLIAGEESGMGLFVKTVDGITADDAKQQWWCFTRGGEDIFSAVDTTPIADGEAYEITLITGY